MNFIFFGRLAKEKGFDLLIHSLENITQKTGELPGNFFLFGEGDLKKELFQTFGESPLFEDCSGFTPAEIADKIELLEISEEGEGCKIFFFGWQSQGAVRSVLEVSHFSLMPSRFLETFGLSALESLSEGVPVIGFQKGGLIPFIPKELAVKKNEITSIFAFKSCAPYSPYRSYDSLRCSFFTRILSFFYFSKNTHLSLEDEENIEALSNKIMEVSEKYSSFSVLMGEEESDWDTLSHESRRIADSYTEGRWMRQVREILPSGTKRILLASDYTTLLGGIETHVQTIARTLRKHGYEVEIFGWNLPKGRWTKLLRLAGLVYSLCNISSAWGIRKKIREYKPDVIWLHSVSRFLGPLTVREVVKWGKNKTSSSRHCEGNEAIQGEKGSIDMDCFVSGVPPGGYRNDKKNFSEISTLVTYHDLGLLSPFPSKVESEEMIPKNPRLGAFLGAVRSNNPIIHLATYCKYFQVLILRKLLKKVDIHIVPSAFLVSHIRDIGEVPEEQIVVLEHFL